MKVETKRTIKKIIIVVMTIMAAISLAQGVKNGMSSSKDFLYYEFRKAVFEHSFSDCQFPSTFWLMFFFGLLPEMKARAAWIICNLVFTGIITLTLRMTFLRQISLEDYFLLILIMISGGPWRTNLSNGQYNLAVMAFFLLAVWLSDNNKEILAGLFFSMCLFKYQMSIPLGTYFLYQRKYRMIITSVVVSAISLIGSAYWFGGLYEVTQKQLLYSIGALSDQGDVDIESILGLGKFIIPIFLIGVLLLVLLAYSDKWKRDDTLFFCISLFVGWAFAYQRIYSFNMLIVPLGYAWYMMKNNRSIFYVMELSATTILTISFFWARTVSDTYGLLLSRLIFYPTFILFLTDIGIKNKELVFAGGKEGIV